MSIISKLREWLRIGPATKSESFETRDFTRWYATENKYNVPDPAAYAAQADLYRTLSWISSAISIKARTAATAKFSVEQIVGEENKDIPNHDFERLLDHPNPLMSRSEFIESISSYYSLTGNAYIWLNRLSENEPPLEMWVIPTSEILPVPDDNLFIKGYEYVPMPGQLIPPWQIVHLKNFNPASLFVGLSPIEAIVYQAHADLGRSKTDSRLYNENNGQAPSILLFNDKYQAGEWAELNKSIQDNARSAKRFMTMDNGKSGVQWIQSQMSNADMQFLEMRNFTKEEIYNLFAPGLASVLSVNATEANALTGKATFIEFDVWPFLDSLAQKFNNEILPIYGENLTGHFDDIRVKNKVLEFQEITLYSLTHTVAEVRKKYWKDDPLGDDRDKLIPSQVTPDVGDGSEPEEEPEPVAPIIPPPAPAAPVPAEMPEETPPVESEDQEDDGEMQAEMKRWRRVARKCIEQGKPQREFKSDILPSREMTRIREGLRTCKTIADIDTLFDGGNQDIDPLADELKRATDLLEQIMQQEAQAPVKAAVIEPVAPVVHVYMPQGEPIPRNPAPGG